MLVRKFCHTPTTTMPTRLHFHGAVSPSLSYINVKLREVFINVYTRDFVQKGRGGLANTMVNQNTLSFLRKVL